MMDGKHEELFSLTKEAFEQSEIRNFARKNGHVWNYSLMATGINVGAPLILGFNFGADQVTKYKPQTQLPLQNFKQLMVENELGSFSKVYNSLVKYCPDEDVDNYMMSNYCFFRSKSERQIKGSDLRLCRPIFEKLIEIVQPSGIIGFSAKLRNYIENNKLYVNISKDAFPSNKRTLLVSKGEMKIGNRVVPFFMLPHPNSHFSGEAREKAWNYCFPS